MPNGKICQNMFPPWKIFFSFFFKKKSCAWRQRQVATSLFHHRCLMKSRYRRNDSEATHSDYGAVFWSFFSVTFDSLTVPRRILTPLVADKITEADKKPGRRARCLCYCREANCVSEVVLAHALHKNATKMCTSLINPLIRHLTCIWMRLVPYFIPRPSKNPNFKLLQRIINCNRKKY